MRWCLVWMKCKPMHHRNFLVKEIIVLQAFIMKIHCAWKKLKLVRLSWEASFKDVRFQLLQASSPNTDNENVKRHSEMISNYAVMVLIDVVTERWTQVSQSYASFEAVLAVSQSAYVHGRSFAKLEELRWTEKFHLKHSWGGKHYSASLCMREI